MWVLVFTAVPSHVIDSLGLVTLISGAVVVVVAVIASIWSGHFGKEVVWARLATWGVEVGRNTAGQEKFK
jgi:hypothetical protein